MDFSLLLASPKHKTVIENLMQFYIYDFSEYMNLEVGENGQFPPYSDLDNYWTDKGNKFPYIIAKDGKYVGFALIKLNYTNSRTYFSIAEFFILKKYRLQGGGKLIAFQIFNLHKGLWEVFQRDTNKPAQLFWRKIIKEYTKGRFSEHSQEGKLIQEFES
jgi:predicted acetyltransferase